MPSFKTSTNLLVLLATTSLLWMNSCQSSRNDVPMDAGQVSAAERQIARGAEVYTARCARCHGDAGQGTSKGPPVVGGDALPRYPREWQKRTGEFRTALDVATFATMAMPPSAAEREGIAIDDYWATLAFALSANGVSLSEPVSAASAGEIFLHP